MSNNETTERIKKILERNNNFSNDNDYVSEIRYGPSLDDVLSSESDIAIDRDWET